MNIRKKSYWRSIGQTSYLKPKFRFLFALFSAQLISTHIDHQSFWEDYVHGYYYVSLTLITLVSYLIIALVIRITSGLDYFYPWTRSFKRRFARQLICGIGMPLLPVVLCATIYFIAYKIPVWEMVYFSRYFHQMIVLLAALNGYLFFIWVNQHRNRKILRTSFMHAEAFVNSDLYDHIAYIFTNNKAYFSVSFTGEKLIWAHSISKSMLQLPMLHFISLRQDIIVNRKAIVDVILSKKGAITVILLAPLQKSVLVSQRNQLYFKQWFYLPVEVTVENNLLN